MASSFWQYKDYENYEDIRVFRIGASKRQPDGRKRLFSVLFNRYIFGTFRDNAEIIIWQYIVPRWLSIDPKQMTLNGLSIVILL